MDKTNSEGFSTPCTQLILTLVTCICRGILMDEVYRTKPEKQEELLEDTERSCAATPVCTLQGMHQIQECLDVIGEHSEHVSQALLPVYTKV